MNRHFSTFFLVLCLILLASNHYWINWEGYTRERVATNLFEVIRHQRTDLEEWADGRVMDPAFRKRTLCKGRLQDWSDDRPFDYNLSIDSIGVIENEHGVFLFQSIRINECQYFSGYPLYEYYSISNQYLKTRRGDKLTHHIKGISGEGSYQFENLLSYDIKPVPSPLIDGIIAFILIVVFLVEYIRYSNRGVKPFLLATIIITILRLAALYFEAFDLLFRFSLFDPIHFTSSFINPTLGDLFLNAILILVISIFLSRYAGRLSIGYGWMMLTSLCLGLSLLIFHVPWSILNNSQISFDVGESINFSFLRIFAFACIMLIGSAYFVLMFYLSKYLLATNKTSSAVILSTIIGVVVLILNPMLSFPVFLTSILLYLSKRINWEHNLGDFNYKNLLYILILSVALGTLLAHFTYKHGERDELFAKRKFANYLLLKRDVLGEYYLNQSIEKLTNDSTLMMVASEGSRATLEKSLMDEFASPYFKKYSIEIVFQDYQRLRVNTRFTRESGLLTADNASDYNNIHFVDQGTSFKYIAKLNIGDLVTLMIFQIKKRVPTTVYPALLTDSKFITSEADFDYAVFSGNEILFQRSKFGQGEWPQDADFNDQQLYREGIEKNGRHYFGVETNDGRTILIISENYPTRSLLANFSFFFLLFLFSFSLFSAITSIYYHKQPKLNFTSKIQLYLSMAFIAPLLATGFALLTTLNNSYKEEINRSYLKQALYISEILSDNLESNELASIDEETLDKMATFLESDISFYNESGYLLSTSQPDIFSLGLQSNLINPVVFDELLSKNNQSMIANESIGSLDYKVCYAVVNTSNNQVGGFIAMPFFDSRNHLRRQQIDVFDNLITIFGFIFVVAIFLGNFILNNLLAPLRMVAGKIRQVTLQDVNQPILYESTDEIGSLVKDYNQMLIKLEESKQALAKSQKETAWKEIAKQVAHEIKNPLTPMQLKIQQLLRKYEKGSKAYDSLASLLTQVDTLSQIAQSFSAFAEMPVPINVPFRWNKLIEEVTQLYGSDEVNIQVHCDRDVMINADQDIFRRILNNIVLNAIQSVDDGVPMIDIKLIKKSGKAILSVQDNGKGIEEGLKDKIFLNYFSTKTTGSGIGLALAKKGIENAGGNIWFESKQGEGTTFYISMPTVAAL